MSFWYSFVIDRLKGLWENGINGEKGEEKL